MLLDIHTYTRPDRPGVNQYTGAAEGDDASNDHDLLGQGQDHNGIEDQDQDCPIAEEDSLPEERFHRADIVSQHMIDTREKQRQEKVSTNASISCMLDTYCLHIFRFIFVPSYFRFLVVFCFCCIFMAIYLFSPQAKND